MRALNSLLARVRVLFHRERMKTGWMILCGALGLGACADPAADAPQGDVRVACAMEAHAIDVSFETLMELDRACREALADAYREQYRFRDELVTRVTLWDGQTPIDPDLRKAARRFTRSGLAEIVYFEFRDATQNPVSYDDYECLRAEPPWDGLIAEAEPGSYWMNCQRLAERAPDPADPAALAQALPWDGQCPGYETVILREADLRPAAYAAMMRGRAALDCMVTWSRERAEITDIGELYYWMTARALVHGEPVPHPPPGLAPVFAESAREAAVADFGEPRE